MTDRFENSEYARTPVVPPEIVKDLIVTTFAPTNERSFDSSQLPAGLSRREVDFLGQQVKQGLELMSRDHGLPGASEASLRMTEVTTLTHLAHCALENQDYITVGSIRRHLRSLGVMGLYYSHQLGKQLRTSVEQT